MEKELVLKVMKEAGKPIAAGEVATLSGLDRKVVDKVFTELKKVYRQLPTYPPLLKLKIKQS